MGAVAGPEVASPRFEWWGGVAGLASTAIWVVVGVFALGPDESSATSGELLSFYNDPANQVRVFVGGVASGGLASVLLLAYVVAFCQRLDRAGARAAVVRLALACGVAAAAVSAVAVGIAVGVPATLLYSQQVDAVRDPELVLVAGVVGNHWLQGVTGVLLAPFVLGTAVEARRLRLLPGWLTRAGLVIGGLTLLSQVFFTSIPALLWVVPTSVWLLRAGRREPAGRRSPGP